MKTLFQISALPRPSKEEWKRIVFNAIAGGVLAGVALVIFRGEQLGITNKNVFHENVEAYPEELPMASEQNPAPAQP